MKTEIQTPGFKARPELLHILKNRVERLGILSDRILAAQVCLTIDSAATRENKRCEIRLVIAGNDLFASRQCRTFRQSIIETCHALRQQVIKWKNVHNGTRLQEIKETLDKQAIDVLGASVH